MTPQQAELSRVMAGDAVGYFLAARKVAEGEDFYGIIAFYRMPLNFLLAQSCELALKSMLLTKAWDRPHWDKIRHDLVTLAATATAEGLTVLKDFEDYCRVMGDAHKNFDFRYSGHDSPPFISPQESLAMIEPQLRLIMPFGIPAP